MVVIKAFLTPQLAMTIAMTGATQLVVQEALSTISSPRYSLSLTPRTKVLVSESLEGAEMITFLAPAVKCAPAFSLVRKAPVHSRTTSTPNSFQGSSAGSLIDKDRIFLPPTIKCSPSASTDLLNLP